MGELTTMKVLKLFNNNELFLSLDREQKHDILFLYSEKVVNSETRISPGRWISSYMKKNAFKHYSERQKKMG